jgi:ceramide glucosyltransferase
MSIISIICLVVLCMHLAGFFSLLAILRKRNVAGGTDYRPHVAVLKPLKGFDEGIRDNLETFFELRYPDYELIFGVERPDDPVIAVVRGLMAEHCSVRARLVIGGQDAKLLNPKVRNLATMLPLVRGDFVVISDSNVRVRPDYLDGLMAHFEDPRVGLVTNLIAGVGEQTSGSMLEHLHLNSYIATAQAFAQVFAGFTSVIGKSMAMRVSALRASGGLEPLADYLAEDYLLGRRMAKNGYRVVLSADPVENYNAHTPIYSFLDRHYRWLGMRWRINPFSCLLELITIPTPWMVAWMIIDPTRAPMAMGLLLALALVEQLSAALVRGGRPLPLRSILLKPVKDLCHVMVLVTSLFNDRVNWRGHLIRLGWKTRITILHIERRKELPPFLFPMRMGDEWPSARAPWVERSAGPRG